MSKLLVIGESPGKEELKGGIPFIGPSGKVLDAALGTEPQPYYINALQCYPGSAEEKSPETLAIATQHCRNHVLEEIKRAPRDVILALGNPALWSITEDYGLKITQERGKFLKTPLASVGLIPSVHPAFLLRGGKGGTYQQYVRDLKYARALAAGSSPKSPPRIRYVVAKDYNDLRSWSRLFKYFTDIGADIETSGFVHMQDRILCIGFAGVPGYVYVVPEHLVKYVGILFDNDANFVWHNGKFDVKFLHWNDIQNARVDDDTMLMSYALDEIGGIHDLEQVSSDWMNSPNWKAMLEQYLPTKNKRKASYTMIPRPILHKYMAYDVGNTRALKDILYPQVQQDPHLKKLYHRTFIPASSFLANVEKNGIYVDKVATAKNAESYLGRREVFGDQLRELGKTFPDSGYTEKLPGSHKQLAKLFYEDLKFPKFRNKTSTDNDNLERLLEVTKGHPAVIALRQYRKVAKEYGTYIKPLTGSIKGKEITPSIIREDGRVHASYLIHGTRTGRLASRDPNLQNVPRNPIIRGQYIAAPRRRLLEIDLNQAELRILAHLSGDTELCKIYTTAGMSLHDEVRAEIWGYAKDWSPSQVAQYLQKFRLTEETRYDQNGEDLLVAEQKMRAKNVNFGVVYGITSAGLAEQTDSPVKDCQMWIDKWMRKFNGAAKFLQQCETAPFEGRTLITPFGNKKRPGCVSKEKARDISNEYKNFPEQACASHCTLHAGIELEETLRHDHDTIVVNLIHDALLLEAPDDDQQCREIAKITIAKMEDIPRKWGFRRVPFIAEAKQGYRWGSLSKMKLAA